MLYKMKDLICKCGLKFMYVDWIHSRKRGWCCYKCRKTHLLEKRNLRVNTYINLLQSE